MPIDQLIFVGYEINEAMRAQFDAVPPKHRAYLEDPSFLETVVIGETRYIGKRAEASCPLDRLEDAARNVVSLLNRLAPGMGYKVADTLILAVEAPAPTGGEAADDVQNSDGPGFEYADLVD
ncbi:MAG: hypothetical protein MUC50_19285 [Myxococcota bacterium]|jgi:hypothetical protein|nr:hypothetical protein [Myxococcota bacterium]